MYVKVLKCDDSRWAHSTHIGEVFTVWRKSEEHKQYVTEPINSDGDRIGIPFDDCIEIKDLTNETIVNHPVMKTQLQILQETVDALVLSAL